MQVAAPPYWHAHRLVGDSHCTGDSSSVDALVILAALRDGGSPVAAGATIAPDVRRLALSALLARGPAQAALGKGAVAQAQAQAVNSPQSPHGESSSQEGVWKKARSLKAVQILFTQATPVALQVSCNGFLRGIEPNILARSTLC